MSRTTRRSDVDFVMSVVRVARISGMTRDQFLQAIDDGWRHEELASGVVSDSEPSFLELRRELKVRSRCDCGRRKHITATCPTCDRDE